MKEKMLEQFRFSEELKEKIIGLVLYQKQSAKEMAKKYDLPNVLSLISIEYLNLEQKLCSLLGTA